MTATSDNPICLLTGARGYLGSRIKTRFEREGWRVVALVRAPGADEIAGGRAIEFRLGEELKVATLRGAQALVHCAYDFSIRDWTGIELTNVLGAEKLFADAREANVPRRIFISSMSAYEGCVSLYGRAKLEVEKRLGAAGAALIRPGLIWGERPSGIFGNLVEQVRKSNWLPLFGGGTQFQYLTHDGDLSELALALAAGKIDAGAAPITAAHNQAWTFRSILEALGRAQKKNLRFVPVPWRMAWLGIKSLEVCGARTKFRSDSLVSLMHQNPNPSFELTHRLGLKFRPFDPAALKV
jgi:nucleoside-diphosphate-sugar epimerase